VLMLNEMVLVLAIEESDRSIPCTTEG